MERPRGRGVNGGGEIASATWDVFAADDLLQQVVVERMLAGVATRRHVDAAEPVGETLTVHSTSKSSVSRRFVTATKNAMADLLARDLSQLDMAVLMLDGVHFAEDCLVVAMVICADGIKIPVGLAHGDTENATLVKGVETQGTRQPLRNAAVHPATHYRIDHANPFGHTRWALPVCQGYAQSSTRRRRSGRFDRHRRRQ